MGWGHKEGPFLQAQNYKLSFVPHDNGRDEALGIWISLIDRCTLLFDGVEAKWSVRCGVFRDRREPLIGLLIQPLFYIVFRFLLFERRQVPTMETPGALNESVGSLEVFMYKSHQGPLIFFDIKQSRTAWESLWCCFLGLYGIKVLTASFPFLCFSDRRIE